MKRDSGTDLYPPVLPSWGSMMPSSPPSAYGNITFEPDRPIDSRIVAAPNTDIDQQALAALDRIFQRRLRTLD